MDQRVADTLAELVIYSGKSHRDLAALTGMSKGRIGIILRAETPPATVGEVFLLCEALHVNPSSVFRVAEM